MIVDNNTSTQGLQYNHCPPDNPMILIIIIMAIESKNQSWLHSYTDACLSVPVFDRIVYRIFLHNLYQFRGHLLHY